MNLKRFLIVLVLCVGLCITASAVTVDEAIAYYSSADTTNCKPPATAFKNNISATYKSGPTAGSVSYFTTSNDSYWDARDIGFVCAHGNTWIFALSNGTVYLDNLTDGWGEVDLEFAILYSCMVVASPIEKPTNWNKPWVIETTDVFDCLHIVNGFRTNSYVAPAVNVTTYYCQLVNGGGYVLQSWFDAIYAYGYYWTEYDQGTSMYYGMCEYNILTSDSPDPTQTQTSDFYCMYME
jgi:hypothetical protein